MLMNRKRKFNETGLPSSPSARKAISNLGRGRGRGEIDGTPGVGIPSVAIPAMSSLSTSVFKNVKEWWGTRKKGDGTFQDANGTDGAMTTPYQSEEETTDLAVLPSALTVKTFAQRNMDRAREQQRSHHEFV